MELSYVTLILVLIACAALSTALFLGLSYRKSTAALTFAEQKIAHYQLESLALSNEIAQTRAELAAEKRMTEEKITQFNDSKKLLTDQFKTLAQEIFEEKSTRFATQNQQNLDLILKPLQDKITDFRLRVDEVHSLEVKERASLKEQIIQLSSLNEKMSNDANALTKALRGDSKTQGDWGELVLETILENCGLRKGHEFDVQDTQRNADGQIFYPDVVIHLPDNKHIVIDSKVSIAAYTRSVQTDDIAQQKLELTAHVNAVRAHMTGLATKNYQNLYGLGSIDFVLMFIPIEPAFLAAIKHQSLLFQEALSKNIVLVCPSTLHATMRTIAHVWRQEHQNRNALEIARLCGTMHDKFVGFVEDLENVGKNISHTQKSYDEAYKKLSTGNGNLVKAALRVKELGVKPNKSLPQTLIERSSEE